MNRRPQHGFTLLEMMLVIVLIGIATGMVMGTLPDSSRYDIRRDSQRLAQNLCWLADRATVGRHYYGLYIDAAGWQLMERKTDAAPTANWQPLALKKIRHQSTLPAGFSLALRSEGVTVAFSPRSDDPVVPQIVLLPGGEITPFQLTFLDNQSTARARINVEMSGEITWLDEQELEDLDEK